MATSDIVRINIGGQEYTLKTSADEKYLQSVASYVNDRIREIEGSTSANQSQLRTMVLSAMNITDELFAEKQKNSRILGRFESRLTAIREYISEKLDGST